MVYISAMTFKKFFFCFYLFFDFRLNFFHFELCFFRRLRAFFFIQGGYFSNKNNSVFFYSVYNVNYDCMCREVFLKKYHK